ncbi:trypsin-like peptidase domain-containing protein [Bdellovibrionota bacterium FG-2]
MAGFDKIKDFRITKENIAQSATWVFILKFLVVAFVAGFFVRAMWPTKPAPRTSARMPIVGEVEQQLEPQMEPRVELRMEPRFERRMEPAVEPQGVALQVPQPGDGGAIDESLHQVVSLVRPAVIKIIVVPNQRTGTDPNTGIKMGDPFVMNSNMAVGSGVIIDSKGLFITTKHVVGDNNNLQVVLYRAGQNQFTARIIARDPDSPLVIGKIRSTEKFPFARMGNSDRLRTGDVVMAVGNPFSLSGTVTSGIVSGKKDVTVNGMLVQGAIQTDATINDGNSGGPLVNADGEVVGITFASYVQGGNFTGIGFAVPINFAKEAWGTAQ